MTNALEEKLAEVRAANAILVEARLKANALTNELRLLEDKERPMLAACRYANELIETISPTDEDGCRAFYISLHISANVLHIADFTIQQDADGKYCLYDEADITLMRDTRFTKVVYFVICKCFMDGLNIINEQIERKYR